MPVGCVIGPKVKTSDLGTQMQRVVVVDYRRFWVGIPVRRERQGVLNTYCIDYTKTPPSKGIGLGAESSLYSSTNPTTFRAIRAIALLETDTVSEYKQIAVNAVLGQNYNDYKKRLLNEYVDYIREKEREAYNILGKDVFRQEVAKRGDYKDDCILVYNNVLDCLKKAKKSSLAYGLTESYWSSIIKRWEK